MARHSVAWRAMIRLGVVCRLGATNRSSLARARRGLKIRCNLALCNRQSRRGAVIRSAPGWGDAAWRAGAAQGSKKVQRGAAHRRSAAVSEPLARKHYVFMLYGLHNLLNTTLEVQSPVYTSTIGGPRTSYYALHDFADTARRISWKVCDEALSLNFRYFWVIFCGIKNRWGFVNSFPHVEVESYFSEPLTSKKPAHSKCLCTWMASGGSKSSTNKLRTW